MRNTILTCMSICCIFGLTKSQSNDGSRCQGVLCSPPTPGSACEARYERDDGCCPVWYCTINGYTSTIYGKISGGGGGQSSYSYSSSSSDGGGGAFAQQSYSNGGFGNLPGFGGSQQSSYSSGGFGNLPGFGGFKLQLPAFGNLLG